MDTIITEITKFIFSEQVFIATLGVTAIALSQSKNKRLHRWACIFGLIGQPFWFYMAWKTASWGVFLLCIFYTWAWLKGFKTYWIDVNQAT